MGLLDVLQSASNAVAGNVAGPVDLLSFALRKAGIPIPEDALGGSEWMKRKGLMRDVPHGAEQVVGETLGLLAPTAIAASAPKIARGLLQAQANAAAPKTLHPETGAIVWHGSPYKFDKFDASKIGTGEGAQAYGHGLYTAEARDVAKSYADELGELEMLHNGKRVGVFDKDPAANAAHQIRATNGDIQKALKRAQSLYTGSWKDSVVKEIERLGPGEISERLAGNLYKIDLPDEHIARMLDWDKPLSQQPEQIQSLARSLAQQEGDPYNLTRFFNSKNPNGGPLGQEIYNALSEKAAADARAAVRNGQLIEDTSKHAKRAAADALRQQGIPGIRYLDGGSRGAGQGTSNFVIFPGLEDQLKILERNGVGLLTP